MSNKRHVKASATFVLALLTFYFSMVTYTPEWLCECDKHTEKVTCCCNCPKCVEARGGFLSYCRVQNHVRPEDAKVTPVLASLNCVCGSGKAVFNIINDSPFVPPSNLHSFSTLDSSPAKAVNDFLKLEELSLSPERPG